MTSTVQRSCTGFVPESITGGSAAGQDAGDRYRSRLEMKRTTGNADQGKRGANAADLRPRVLGGTAGHGTVRPRVVPVFYRRLRRDLVNTTAALIVGRQDRKAGAR